MDVMEKLCYLNECKKLETLVDEFEIYHDRDLGSGISLNVKVHSLPLTPKQRDVAYLVVSDESVSEMFYEEMKMVIEEFEPSHYHVCFAGRSGGHLVLCKRMGVI